MKKLFWIALLLPFLASCNKDGWSGNEDLSTGDELSHDMIVLGDQLEDPYSVSNITKALESLYSTKSDRVDISATHIYLRFLPANDDELDYLLSLDIHLTDYPLDYEIVQDGDYYHDPDVDEESITWQYAVVDSDFEIPEDIQYEILDECYIPETESTKSDDGIDWEAVEMEAFRLTGNEDMLDISTKGSKTRPEGRITIVDEDYNEGKPFGVAGVKVSCNVFVKFAHGYTDRDGYYEMSKKFSSKPRYRLMFKNNQGFSIGVNLIIVPASTSALGKGSAEGIDVEVTKDSDRKLWCRCIVNNAGYDYYTRCEDSEDLNISTPPSSLRIWIFQKMEASSTVMLKHGAVIDNSLISTFLGDFTWIVKLFLPDLTIGLKNKESYSDIYTTAIHELSHASHFAQVGKSYWNNFIKYIIKSYLADSSSPYGSGTSSNAGYCEVGEMWGFFMENEAHKNRYGGEWPSSGSSFWFHPQIFSYLYERGLSVSGIFKALDSSVTSRDELRDKLLELNEGNSTLTAAIEQVFARYDE